MSVVPEAVFLYGGINTSVEEVKIAQRDLPKTKKKKKQRRRQHGIFIGDFAV